MLKSLNTNLENINETEAWWWKCRQVGHFNQACLRSLKCEKQQQQQQKKKQKKILLVQIFKIIGSVAAKKDSETLKLKRGFANEECKFIVKCVGMKQQKFANVPLLTTKISKIYWHKTKLYDCILYGITYHTCCTTENILLKQIIWNNCLKWWRTTYLTHL